LGNELDIRLFQEEIMAFADTFVGDTYPVSHFKSGVFDGLLGAGHLAAVYGYQSFGAFSRLHHAVDMSADAGQAVNLPHTQRIQGYRGLVGNLPTVGAPRAGEYRNLLGFTLAGYDIVFLRLIAICHRISSFLLFGLKEWTPSLFLY
jgi:hypothetical protein